MNQTIYLTTNEYQNEALTQAYSCGGLVLTSGLTTMKILREYGNHVITMSSSTHANGSTAASQHEQGATSAIVKGIEKDLGIDLEVNSDSELYSILRKNGAGPLLGLLKMAYGTEKEKTETKR